jgi:hypothetical protein
VEEGGGGVARSFLGAVSDRTGIRGRIEQTLRHTHTHRGTRGGHFSKGVIYICVVYVYIRTRA